MSSTLKLCLILTAVAILAGCYRIDVQQGNILPSSAIQKVHAGMSTNQVKRFFGEPVLTDVFTGNRLVYVYTFKPGIGDRHEKRLLIYFKNNRVTHFTTDETVTAGKTPSPFSD